MRCLNFTFRSPILPLTDPRRALYRDSEIPWAIEAEAAAREAVEDAMEEGGTAV